MREFILSNEIQTESNLIGAIDGLEEGGKGLTFGVKYKSEDEVIPAFAIRYDYQLFAYLNRCLLYTSPSPRDRQKSRMPSSA